MTLSEVEGMIESDCDFVITDRFEHVVYDNYKLFTKIGNQFRFQACAKHIQNLINLLTDVSDKFTLEIKG